MPTPINERKLANAIRVLSFDAVQKANSGHPGAPMGMADIAEVLWRKFLKHNPADPQWHNRDRFVLSNGHGSMLIYSLLHLSGYDVSVDDLKGFRQLHSKTPGHPELGYTPGIETTTGPLGQGIANAVGFAIAEKTLAAQFNRDGHNIVDHHTYTFLGDGCLMEGISHEVCSLAGTLGLGKLVFFYDDNGISIDGDVEGWFTDDTQARFEAYGWQVIKVDGHDTDEITKATEQAIAETAKPSLIICKTTIGAGSPNKQGLAASHGAPLGDDEIVLTRDALAWTHAPFELDDEIYEAWDAKAKGDVQQKNWDADFEAYKKAYPELASELLRRLNGELPADFESQAQAYIQQTQEQGGDVASRKASQNAINTLQPLLPELLGGSADLAGSNLTLFKGAKGIEKDSDGNYIYYGVREFGMTAIANGIALHGGFIPYVATFLMFMEYARNAVRMGALMKQRVIHVYTHDSIGLGEDGPTHQPIEQTMSLRMIPGLSVFRPADALETATAWQMACMNLHKPTALLLSRQKLPVLHEYAAIVHENAYKGAYVLNPGQGETKAVLIATGSEVHLALEAQAVLAKEGTTVSVVSMPSWDTFEMQSADYKASVLPEGLPKIAVEAGVTLGWSRYTGSEDNVLGINRFGASAPGDVMMEKYGFTVENLVAKVKSVL